MALEEQRALLAQNVFDKYLKAEVSIHLVYMKLVFKNVKVFPGLCALFI